MKEESTKTIKHPVDYDPEEQKIGNMAAIEALRKIREEGDEQDQKETMAILEKALGQDRLSFRKLF